MGSAELVCVALSGQIVVLPWKRGAMPQAALPRPVGPNRSGLAPHARINAPGVRHFQAAHFICRRNSRLISSNIWCYSDSDALPEAGKRQAEAVVNLPFELHRIGLIDG